MFFLKPVAGWSVLAGFGSHINDSLGLYPLRRSVRVPSGFSANSIL